MTPDTYGHTCSQPFATYNPTSDCSRTWQDTGLWGLMLSSVTLPAWGGMRSGSLFEHQTPEPLTVEPESSWLLGTPRAQMGAWADSGKLQPMWDKGRRRFSNLEEQILVALPLMPTPCAADWRVANGNVAGTQIRLPEVVLHQLGDRSSPRLNGGRTSWGEDGQDPLW